MADLTRRSFVTLGGVAAATAGAAALTGCSSQTSDSSDEDTSEESTTTYDENDQVELDVPEEAAPEQTEYECDILVVGGGVAGQHAAISGAEAGKTTIMIDKGYPGYSGLTPFACETNYFDADLDDDREKVKTFMMQSNEYLANLNWLDVWCDRSKEYFERLSGWGIVDQYEHASETEYWVDGYFDGTPGHDDKRGYFRSVLDYERHSMPEQILADAGVEVLDHTMVYDVVVQDDRVVGAMAYHVPSGTGITIKAKAVILCTGSGCVKPQGYPVGGSSYDGLYIGYKHGLPIGGMEFEDYHLSYSGKPGLVLTTAGWAYCESMCPSGPGIHSDSTDDELWASAYTQKTVYNNVVYGLSDPDPYSMYVNTGTPASDDPDDPRQGNISSSETHWSTPGAAPGMSLHMASGIFNGWDDVTGQTGLAGLYCAGDGTYASAIGGAIYTGLMGLTTSSCGLQGWIAAENAAEYADTVELVDLPEDDVNELYEEFVGPLSVETGYDPSWANQQLLNIMASQATLFLKSEKTLNAALAQVEFLRDNIVPKLKAKNSHEVRLCREFIQKVCACEIKLRAGLERKESRGMHYRTDYPYRDDSYLGYFTFTKTDDDDMSVDFVEVPDEWKGDLDLDYASRYPLYHFPGEEEALGITFPEEESSW